MATGIALAFTRSPLETAVSALDMDHLTQGRFTLGLGTSVRWWHEDLYGVAYDRPVARLAEATRIIKLILTGQARKQGRFDGEFWQLDFGRLALKPALRADLPIWIAALRSPLVKVAGLHADGLIGHPSWSVKWALEQIEGPYAAAVAASGRTRSDVHVNLWQVVAPNPDRAESVNDAKRHVATYGSIGQYEPYFAAHGYAAQARLLQQAAATGDPKAFELVPEDMARTFVVCGTPGEVADQLRPLWAASDSLCLQAPPLRADARAAYESRIAELFAG